MKIESSAFRRRGSDRRLVRVALPAAAGLLLVLLGLIGAQFYRAAPDSTTRPAGAGPLPKALAQPNLFKPLTAEQAIDANGKLPFAPRRDDPARNFILKVGSDDRGRAVECLAQAIYYEAASEGSDGQRAVAQVVLNRLRHPGYPSTVCGVVFQGSERVMGCQFTFTCDGSLLRQPNAAMFGTARRIAIEALAGRVFAPVGHATNYHADYVLPYWAASLDKKVQIGRHIFYRLKGSLGSSSAFGQHYAGREPAVVPQATTIVAGQAVEAFSEILAPLDQPGAIPADRPSIPLVVADAFTRGPLVADSGSGTLITDNGAPGARKKTIAVTKDCTETGSGKLMPAAPNELRSDPKAAC